MYMAVNRDAGHPMALDIIGAGFGRTGTLSLKFALETLGVGPCHHMHEIRKKPEQVNAWYDAASGVKVDWDAVFEGFKAQMDWPGAAFWRELTEAFPKAKVILTVREPESWFRSIQKTIVPSTLIGRRLEDDPISKSISEMIYQTVYLPLFDGRLDDRAHALKVYNSHIEEVKKTIPKDRLLVFDVKSGWSPLCNFLELDIPKTPFPRTNSTDEFIESKDYLPGDI